MQDMQGFAGPSHCSCISRLFHRLRGVASSQSFSCGHLAPAGCLVRRQRAGRGRGADRIRHLDDHDYGEESGRSTSGTPRPIPRSRSWVSAAADEDPGRLACASVVPLFVPETQLPASDSPRSPVLPAVACQPAPARRGGSSTAAFRARCALEPRLPTVTEMRVWRIAHGPGLHGPPGRLSSKNPLSPAFCRLMNRTPASP